MQISARAALILSFLTTFFFASWVTSVISKEIKDSTSRVSSRLDHLEDDMKFITGLKYFQQALDYSSAGSAKVLFSDYLTSHLITVPGLRGLCVYDYSERDVVSYKVQGDGLSLSKMDSIGNHHKNAHFVYDEHLYVPIGFSEGRYALVAILNIRDVIASDPVVITIAPNWKGETAPKASIIIAMLEKKYSLMLGFFVNLAFLFLILKLYRVSQYLAKRENDYLQMQAFTQSIKHDISQSFAVSKVFLDTAKRLLTSLKKRVDEPELSKIERWIPYTSAHIEYAKNIFSMLDDMSFEIEENNLSVVCTKISEELSALTEGKSIIKLVLRHTQKTYFDDLAIERVIRNLVRNAHMYSSGEIWIETRDYDTEKKVRVTVGNTGSSFGFEQKDVIFRDDFTANGTCLGLGICKRIIESHSNNIFVRSSKGNTEFYFTLDTERIC